MTDGTYRMWLRESTEVATASTLGGSSGLPISLADGQPFHLGLILVPPGVG